MWLTTDIEEVTDMNFNVLWKKQPIINYEKYIEIGSFQKAKEVGAVRLEGKDYIVKDGDIIYFRFNV